MVNKRTVIFIVISLIFLLFSFYPTIYELQNSGKLADSRREFVLEHNYYWPDYNLYLSKIRQGRQGRFTAKELYTGENHRGSLIQEFYVALGWLGRVLNLDPGTSYLLGRIILAPLLLIIIFMLVRYYFPANNSPNPPSSNAPQPPLKVRGGEGELWGSGELLQLLAFLIIIVSGSFPRFYTDNFGVLQIGRYMEWWSNLDALQRITFIPHILFGQAVSFLLLYELTLKQISQIRPIRLISLILLGNLLGLTFPPSLITLNSVLLLTISIKILRRINKKRDEDNNFKGHELNAPDERSFLGYDTWRGAFAWAKGEHGNLKRQEVSLKFIIESIFIILTLPSLLYIFLLTKSPPWTALVQVHRDNPLLIPLDQYILATGPVFFLGAIGAVISILKREKRFQPLIFWIVTTLGFASFFSVFHEQSPLRFTQTGLFIPLGILAAYLLYHLLHLSNLSYLGNLGSSLIRSVILFYLLGSLFMMKNSLDWQTGWIAQKIGATMPDVPYPPQAMYPLRDWITGIRYLRDKTNHEDIVLAFVTAGNYIPAYGGNTVYFGQANTLNYYSKESQAKLFFQGKMAPGQAEIFLSQAKIKYVFYSIQEKELSGGKKLEELYPFLKTVYSNELVDIYGPIND